MSDSHGTPSAYFNGCRCDLCKAAGKRFRTEGNHDDFVTGKSRKPPLFMPGDRTTPYDEADPRHGSLGAYTSGCRCSWCRAAGREYRKYHKSDLKLPKGWNARFNAEA